MSWKRNRKIQNRGDNLISNKKDNLLKYINNYIKCKMPKHINWKTEIVANDWKIKYEPTLCSP